MESTFLHMLVYCQHHIRSKFLAGEAVTTADDTKVLALQRGHYVQIKRFTDAARFFGSVQNCDALHGFG